jgi:hypothetical protein
MARRQAAALHPTSWERHLQDLSNQFQGSFFPSPAKPCFALLAASFRFRRWLRLGRSVALNAMITTAGEEKLRLGLAGMRVVDFVCCV